ncbi:MAG: PEP-CTERM sorting domain-containing protein [Luteolibacter sp.]
MRFHSCLLAAVSLLVSCPAWGTVVAYTTRAEFDSDTTVQFTDTFSDIGLFTSYGSSLSRTAGDYGYTVSTDSTLYGKEHFFDPALGVLATTATITLSGFTGGVYAIGGFFFPLDFSGEPQPGFVYPLSITVTDEDGAVTVIRYDESFYGFVSDKPILSVGFSSDFLNGYPAIDDLVLAKSLIVPEPSAVLLGVVGGLALLRRRR